VGAEDPKSALYGIAVRILGNKKLHHQLLEGMRAKTPSCPSFSFSTISLGASGTLSRLPIPQLLPLSSSELALQSSVPNRPGTTAGPWRAIVPSVPGRVGKDGEA